MVSRVLVDLLTQRLLRTEKANTLHYATIDGSVKKGVSEGSPRVRLGCGVKCREMDQRRFGEVAKEEDPCLRGSGGTDSLQAEAGAMEGLLRRTPEHQHLVIPYH